MKNNLERNIPTLYLITILAGVALLFAVSKSNQSHYEDGYDKATNECYYLTKPTE